MIIECYYCWLPFFVAWIICDVRDTVTFVKRTFNTKSILFHQAYEQGLTIVTKYKTIVT